ncbi:MAG: PLDc N-terminal domain-containing protein [Candidatus Bipolaricaulota bacterium]
MGNIQWADLPLWALAGIVVLGLAQLSLQVFAVVNVFRTPEERLVTGRRWVWVLVIVLGWIGLIVYFTAARRPTVEQDPLHATPGSDGSASAKARQAADLLYGKPSTTNGRRDER